MPSNSERLEKRLADAVYGETNPLARYRKTLAALDTAFADGILAEPHRCIDDEVIVVLAGEVRAVTVEVTIGTADRCG